MTHGHNRKHHHAPRHPHPSSKSAEQPLVKQQPVPGPWSCWVPQENGRWFYKARLQPNGQWEYAFTEGYQSRGGSTYSVAGTTLPPVQATRAAATTQLAATQTPHSDLEKRAATGHGAASKNQPDPTSDGYDDDTTAVSPVGRHVKGPSKNKVKKSWIGSMVKHKGSEKLSAVVKAEKELRFNPNKKVSRWLIHVVDSD